MAGIDGSMAHLSDTLFTTSIATYALAMVGFTAEYAFGRKGRIAATVPVAAPARELVGVGGPPAAEFIDPPVAAPIAPAEGRSFADRIGRASFAITILGVLLHGTSIAVRAIAVDAVPWSNMYEFSSVAGLVGVIAFVAVLWKLPQLRHLGGIILLPVILLMFLAGTVFYSKAQPLVPALQSYWLAIHVTLVSVAEGALMVSAVLTVLYLAKSRYDRVSVRPGYRPGSLGALAARLPDVTALDKAAYRIVAFSFPLYTVAIICGAIWAEAAWGRYWGWDPKETWAFIVWVVYACYLHARATAGWKGRAAAWVNLAGFAAIIFNFVIVNMVISGLHSYAGLS
ncbi:MAG TPA: c-type cytochrome biogenesis protein CcsB [Jatrophihabitantaceae bacterium]|nr:c-type cytochrome biogenesis protein CcsB [Jatrophihabitantaceae bacterium]